MSRAVLNIQVHSIYMALLKSTWTAQTSVFLSLEEKICCGHCHHDSHVTQRLAKMQTPYRLRPISHPGGGQPPILVPTIQGLHAPFLFSSLISASSPTRLTSSLAMVIRNSKISSKVGRRAGAGSQHCSIKILRVCKKFVNVSVPTTCSSRRSGLLFFPWIRNR